MRRHTGFASIALKEWQGDATSLTRSRPSHGDMAVLCFFYDGFGLRGCTHVKCVLVTPNAAYTAGGARGE
jgi:hypothetical protein